MKKLLSVALGLVLAGVVVVPAPAQVGIEAHGLYTFEYKTEDLDTVEELGAGLGVTWKICQYFRIDLAGDYYKPKSRCPMLGEQEKIRFVPVTLGLAVGGPIIDKVFFLYLGGGPGYSFNKSSADDMKVKDCLLWSLYGTLEYFLNENLALQAQYRYSWLRPDIKYKPADLLTKDVNFDHMEARVGLALFF